MAEDKITRREAIKKAVKVVYITPVILTLAAKPSFARGGSPREDKKEDKKSGSYSRSYNKKYKYQKGKYKYQKGKYKNKKG